MAKRKSADKKTGSNSSATERTMAMASALAVGPWAGASQIEVPRALSLVNRRLYRQTRVYRCKLSLTTKSTDVSEIPI